jgi:biotin-dependent carboxylase-like uncharacterized protein
MLKVAKSGFFTSIQDKGRFGYRHMGVPVSGAMDQQAASLANALLENSKADAVMEITMSGPVLEFLRPTYIAITGANLSPSLNGEAIDMHSVHKVLEGDTLTFGRHIEGLRGYLGVKGGLLTETVLNSRSFYKPVTPSARLNDGVEISYQEVTSFNPKISHIITEKSDKVSLLKVSKGPEYDILSKNEQTELFGKPFTIAKENNRMAYQLEETLDTHAHSMLTSATLPGTVQITPAGKLIILMRDGQTTGGYPRILQLSDDAINVLAQKTFGDTISFQID